MLIYYTRYSSTKRIASPIAMPAPSHGPPGWIASTSTSPSLTCSRQRMF